MGFEFCGDLRGAEAPQAAWEANQYYSEKLKDI